jgi:uracil-DNA glycosylase family 4
MKHCHRKTALCREVYGGIDELYEALSPEDGLLFYRGAKYDEDGEGAYVAVGRVGKTVRFGEDLANELFDTARAQQAYTVVDFRPVSFPKDAVESFLGYVRHPQGPQRVRTDRYDTVEAVLDHFGADDDPDDHEDGSSLDEIVHNALRGRGPCEGCPAHETGNSRRVNPGLGVYDADVMFVTEEPKHFVDWDAHENWAAWNEQFMRGFPEADGGTYIRSLLNPLNVSIQDVWIADSVKCPTIDHKGIGARSVSTGEAFDHCRSYLDREIRDVAPNLVVTLGNEASERTLGVFGEPERIHTKSDAGRVFETRPPVVVSPHWGAYNYTSNEERAELVAAVTDSISRVYNQV